MLARPLRNASRLLTKSIQSRCLYPIAHNPCRFPLSRSFFSYPAPRSLNDLVKLERLAGEPAAAVQAIWLDFHLNSPGTVKDTTIAKVLSKAQFDLLMKRSAKNKFFVLPAFKEEKKPEEKENSSAAQQEKSNKSETPPYETVLLNFQFPHILFTSLHEYRSRGASASPYLVVTLYPDLLASHGICLFRADILSIHLSKPGSEELIQSLMTYYFDDSSYSWVEKFNSQPKLFDFTEYFNDFLGKRGKIGKQ